MKPENEIFLKQNLHHFITLERAFYLRGLNVHERGGMEIVMREEFAPNYRADLTCPDCVAEMVKLLYRSYFNYLKAKLNDTNEYKDITEGIQQMMDKEVVEPLTVHASFPSNKPELKDIQFYQLEKHANISV